MAKPLRNIFFFTGIVTVILLLFYVKVYVLEGAIENYCLKKTIDVIGFEKPMNGEKLEFYSRCHKNTSLWDAWKLIQTR